jgi:Putative mono-oxygenase ydhR
MKERQNMITALTTFKLPQPVTREKAREIFSSTAPNYTEVQGLIRKYYLLSEDGGTAGGVYLWRSRNDAEKLYTDDWKRFIAEKYGAQPSVQYFETPVIVDNLVGEILKDD